MLHKSHYLLEHKSFSIYRTSSRCEDSISTEENVWVCYLVYLETVKLILAKGNPHFVCDARVLVKPYKEKGKVPDKYRKLQHQQQQMERGEFSACGGPTGLDSRDPYDLQHGARMFGYTSQAKTYCGERNWWNKLTCSKPLSSKVGD